MDLNQVVITTKYVIAGEPILRVIHHQEDGIFEFVGSDPVDTDDYRLLSMEEIIRLDNTLKLIIGIPPGFTAYRMNANDIWKISTL